MSDENTPKLRLRPKLAGPPPITPANSPAPAPSPATPPPEVKPVAARTRLSIKSDDPGDSDSSRKIKTAPASEVPTAAYDDPQSFPPPPPKQVLVARPKPTLKLTEEVKPADSTHAAPPFPVSSGAEKLPAVLKAPPPPQSKPATAETWPAVLDAPPPPGLAPAIASGDAEPEPAEITAIRKASTYPFPSPTAKFPPLPGLSTTVETLSPEPSEQEGFLKKLLLFGGLALLLLLAGGGFAYFKFFRKPAATTSVPAAPVTAAAPAASPAMEKIKKAVEKAEQETFAPLNEAVAANETPVPVKPEAGPAGTPAQATAPVVTPEPVVAATPPPVPVKPPPPAPSLAFKAWVINLRIRGVRGGEAQRVTIDRTTYVPGDTVNPQLGISFVGYDEESRMLTFQDKTGATFERRH